MNPLGPTPKAPVQRTAEFARVAALPRREWDPAVLERAAEEWTAALKTPAGTMKLRPVQAQALIELRAMRGLFGPIRVGGGKTLIAELAPVVLGARKPLLVIPANLRAKTEIDRAALSLHWRLHLGRRVITYEKISSPPPTDLKGQPMGDILENAPPDLLILDEVHKCKNPDSACTRRILRFKERHPECVVIMLTGTAGGRTGYGEFAHLLPLTLGPNTPAPVVMGEAREWADAIDEGVEPGARRHPGALLSLDNIEAPVETQEQRLEAARGKFHRRFVQSPGIVITHGEDVTTPIRIRAHYVYPDAKTDKLFFNLRSKWEAPDDWTYGGPMEVWACARQLALGFHYYWDPRPPKDWLAARKDWAFFVRKHLERTRKIETEKQVRTLVEAGTLEDFGTLAAWKKIEPTFTIQQRIAWHSRGPIEWIRAWGEHSAGGLIWVEHRELGLELSRITGWPYYRRGGLSAEGKMIEQHPKGFPAIASIKANAEGRNLQYNFSRNLITGAPASGTITEQLIGRTHRSGQGAPEVLVDYYFGSYEHRNAYETAIDAAKMAEQVLGQPQKILKARIEIPRSDPPECDLLAAWDRELRPEPMDL